MKFIFYLKYHTTFGEALGITCNTYGFRGEEGFVEMEYFDDNYWRAELEIAEQDIPNGNLQYNYIFKNKSGEFVKEFAKKKVVDIPSTNAKTIKIYDYWNYAGAFENAFDTSPFKKILLPIHKTDFNLNTTKNATHIFKVIAPLLKADEVLCLCGDGIILGDWNINKSLLMQFDGDAWVSEINFSGETFPIAYKYGIYNRKRKAFVRYEEGGNRTCYEPSGSEELTVLHDGFINARDNPWRGAGVSVPVFSLRSKNGLGIGEFNDITLLADWAVDTGLKLIQILPINDTTATFTWKDSYPYAAISAFALHPIYVNVETIAGKKHKHLLAKIQNKKKQLNELTEVDYEAVLKFKLGILEELFIRDGDECISKDGYKKFYSRNEHWLKPYAAFCFLRDKYQSPDPLKWKSNSNYKKEEVEHFFNVDNEVYKKVIFYCYVQYHLHLQLKDAVDYAHKKGIILKGDIPIGVYRYGCDVWVSPDLYKMEMQAGAPPDDFAVRGQNWGFPTYNWERMQSDGFAWWKDRFTQMSCYFDAFRIDHILGFFRIWSIPIDSVQGIMGRFDPCLPVHVNEFGERGIRFEYERFCQPFITDDIVNSIFGVDAEYVKENFLTKNKQDKYFLVAEFDSQRKVELFFSKQTDKKYNHIQNGLFDLISNVILFEEVESDKTSFHFRIAIDATSSFQNLAPYVKEKMWELYVDYFFRRQNDFWRKQSLKKLPQLKAATNMLICGEDLGMVPHSVPGVMKDLGILSLEIQRMPKQENLEFFKPSNAPYLSVVTPSTHDMSTIRGWWEEDKPAIQRFYNNELGFRGDAPYFCEPWINTAIVMQHLNSPAMWSVFQIQDILGMSGSLRRENPNNERINVPANPNHYWRYRMHIALEQLLREKEFNCKLKEFIEKSGR